MARTQTKSRPESRSGKRRKGTPPARSRASSNPGEEDRAASAFAEAAARRQGRGGASGRSSELQGKVEYGLKVLWEREAVARDIEAEDEDVRRLKAEISAQKGSTYFARMQYGRLIDAALQTRSERYVAEVFARLRDASVALRSN